jgi:murein DD-endopeptidase MepM/ murein hydrolase activator NlpD
LYRRITLTCFLTVLLISVVVAQAQDDAFDAALAAALARHAASTELFSYRELGRTIDPDVGGVVYLEMLTPDSAAVPGIIDWLIAIKQEGMWNLYLPGEVGYQAALEALPVTLRSTLTDLPFRERADLTLFSPTERLSYEFPWENGQWGTVTRSFNRHGMGQIDFDLTGRNVAAAKDGTIIYANDSHDAIAYQSGAWWYWNTVIIEHSPHEYSLYGHLEPGSIPQVIKDACSPDPSQANCSVPVSAGDIIALEGTTGYSSNYHLHLELGQRYGIARYPDTADADGDGDRRESVHTGYVYLPYNAGFSGFLDEEAAAFPYGTLLQAMHSVPLLDTNVVRNGDFSEGTGNWRPSGQVSWSVEEGVMRFLRLNTSEPPDWGGFYQDMGYAAPAHYGLEAAVKLGNSSGYEKYVSVILMHSSGRDYGVMECMFTLPPNTPLHAYLLRGQTDTVWAMVRLFFAANPADSSPAVLVDNVSVRHVDDAPVETQCTGGA